MTGKGDTPEQKVNEAVKELNYHNMLVVIAVADKTTNNIGSIPMNWIKKLSPLKIVRLAREKALGKHQERRAKKRK